MAGKVCRVAVFGAVHRKAEGRGSYWVRADLLELARRHGRPAVALRFPTALDTCLERNAQRPAARRVPDEVLLRQHSLAQDATTDVLMAEGFTNVLVPAFDLPDVRFAASPPPTARTPLSGRSPPRPTKASSALGPTTRS
ncbi:AAA family ATPase [Streptomyces sp. NPDC046161]|uniref:AAA family ATPase n=1 Tax=Streptomyces sp. NPDC046161 TaxID=3155132 RepID=UPI0033ECCF8F